MHVLDVGSGPDLTPPVGPIANSRIEIRISNFQYEAANRQTGNWCALQYAFGSGKQGLSYAEVLEDRKTLFEMHFSYFPHTRTWYITPGHEQMSSHPNSLGLALLGSIPRKCILCHAVTLPADSLLLESKFLGVGCESCHGPGSAHIAAAKTAGATDLHIEHLQSLGGKRMNTLCGRCHRSFEDAMKMPKNQRATQRFFPYALEISRCFQKSNDRLTCSTCHDPHAPVRTDHAYYESRCLQCHASASAVPKQAVGPSHRMASTVVCPVNARTGCIDCHMPQRRVFRGTSLSVSMADHWIRAYRHDRRRPSIARSP